MNLYRTCACSLIALSVVLPRPAMAEEEAPPKAEAPMGIVTPGLFYRSVTGIRTNPLGLSSDFRIGYRFVLDAREDASILTKNTNLAIAATVQLSPAYIKPGVMVEATPIAPLTMYVQMEREQYFGSFGQLQTFASPRDNYSDNALDAGKDAGKPRAVGGWAVTLGGSVQAKWKGAVFRSQLKFVGRRIDVADPYMYDIFSDLLVPTQGWSLQNDTDLGYRFDRIRLLVGARLSIGHAFSSQSHGGDTSEGSPTVRLGPVAAYTIRERRSSWFNAPTLFLATQWWAAHRYRTGSGPDSVSAAVPCVTLGFAFRGDS